ncbi:MAG: cell wall biosynthesis protein [Methanobacteriales archaeon Met13]
MVIMDIITFIMPLGLSAILTLIFQKLFTKIGENLYTPIRGGTPRAVGLAPFLVLLLFFPPPGSYLIAIIGIFALFDDIIGRKNINWLPFEIGQLSRGLGLLLVIIVGYIYYGPVSILIGLMIQPLNIADMQPGTASSTVIIMGFLMAIFLYIGTGNPYSALINSALIILAVCLGYAPLDYQGKIMMGEVGNHSFGVGLGVLYALLGGYIAKFYLWGNWGIFIIVLILLIITSILIAFLRRKNLKIFLESQLEIRSPLFGDYVMDVLTGGGLGDLLRRTLLGKRKIIINNRLGMFLGLRRLFNNPYSSE